MLYLVTPPQIGPKAIFFEAWSFLRKRKIAEALAIMVKTRCFVGNQ